MIDLLNRQERAVLRLRVNCELRGLPTWPVQPIAGARYPVGIEELGDYATLPFHPNADVLYQIGVGLGWHKKQPDEVVAKQQERVRSIAEVMGRAYNLEVCIDGPTFAVGGAQVMYVGLNKPSV